MKDVPPPEENVEIIQKSKKKSKKKMDVGKIKALRKAGWTLQKIADEMGCSDQTIANVLKREEKNEYKD